MILAARSGEAGGTSDPVAAKTSTSLLTAIEMYTDNSGIDLSCVIRGLRGPAPTPRR
jgi:hypothetical protein